MALSEYVDFVPNAQVSAVRLSELSKIRVLGYPVKVWPNYPPNNLYILQCADDDGPTFHCAPGTYDIVKFHKVLNEYRKRHPIGGTLDVLWHSKWDGTPPQEMAEELDKHNQLLQTALDDALKVVVELRNDVYQAQVDAQDWQNKYNVSQRAIATLRVTVNIWKHKVEHLTKDGAWDDRTAGRLCDREQIRVLTNDLTDLNEYIEDRERLLDDARARILTLTDQNTQLELRNERQSSRIRGAREALTG